MMKKCSIRRQSRRMCLIFVLAFCVLQATAPAQNLDKQLETAIEAISPIEVYDYTKITASPEFAGRQTEHEGYAAAAEGAAGKFRSWGLKPLGRNEGYLQAYPSPYTVITKTAMVLHLVAENPDATKLAFLSAFLWADR